MSGFDSLVGAQSQRFLDILHEVTHMCVVAETDLRQQLARKRVHTQAWNIQEASDLDLKKAPETGPFCCSGRGLQPLARPDIVFWYGLCAADFVVWRIWLDYAKAGLVLAMVVMAFAYVNLRFFPTFEYQFNYVLIGLLIFAAAVWLSAPYIWNHSTQRFTS